MDKFVDTNILMYAEDADAGQKHAIASGLVTEMWLNRSGVVSIQVPQELFVNLTKKVAKPIRSSSAEEIIEESLTWRVIANSEALLRKAIQLSQRYSLIFGDASVVAASVSAGCAVLYSEDAKRPCHRRLQEQQSVPYHEIALSPC